MAVRIRLQRKGRKKRPFYRVVVADRQDARDGRFIELVGTYDPLQDPPLVKLQDERIQHWIEKGATPSDTVRSLIDRYVGVDPEEARKRAEELARRKAEKKEAARAAARAEEEAPEEEASASEEPAAAAEEPPAEEAPAEEKAAAEEETPAAEESPAEEASEEATEGEEE